MKFKTLLNLLTAKRCFAVGSLLAVLTATVLATHAFWPSKDLAPNVIKAQYVNASEDTTEPPSIIPPGVKNWKDVRDWITASDEGRGGKYAPPGYGNFLEHMTGFSRKDIDNFVAAESRGETLTCFLPAGTVVNNSGFNRRTGQYVVLRGFRLKKDRIALVTPKGYVPIKHRRSRLSRLFGIQPAMADGMETGVFQNCGNGAQFNLPTGKVVAKPKTKPTAKPKPSIKPKPKPSRRHVCPPQKAPINKFPHTTPHHPGNPSTQPPKANTGKAKPTPGVVPGKPEEVAKQQEEDRDADCPTQYGQPGSDTGETTNPDGTHEEAPAPTAPPDTTSDDVHSGDPGAPN